MKTKMILGTLLIGALAGFTGCKKNETLPAVEPQAAGNVSTTTTEAPSTSARMWMAGKTIMGVSHDPSMKASLYRFTPPPGLIPGFVGGFFVGGTQVTYVTGLAYTVGRIVITTGPLSNFPNRMLTYPFSTPFNAPTIVGTAGLSDIEYNEYNGRMYGIRANAQIVEVNMSTGVQTFNLAPVLGPGLQVKGLCNFNGLLSYGISDNTAAPDNFYAYNPGAPAVTPSLFSTDWGAGDGGMQYADGGTGWVIVTYTPDTKKFVSPAFVVTGPTAIGGGPYLFTDLTSD